MQNDETRLIQAAKRGDQQAIGDLYHLHVQAVYRYIATRVSSPELAEDITSDVFVRALETLATYEPRGVPFLGWLYRIAHGRVVDHYRSRKTGEQPLEDIHFAADTSNPEDEVIDTMQQAQVMKHLQALTEEQQQVVMMRFIQGHNLQTTAQMMGKTEGSIKQLQFRALQTLARLMQGEVS